MYLCVCVWLWLAECRLCLAATTHKICAHVFITVQQSAICKCVRECVCVCDLLTAYLYILLRSVLCSFVSVSQLGIHFPFTNTLAHRCPLLFLLGCCCWAFAAFAYLLGICYTHLQNLYLPPLLPTSVPFPLPLPPASLYICCCCFWVFLSVAFSATLDFGAKAQRDNAKNR